MNRPAEIDANFERAGMAIPDLVIVGHQSDNDWPMHVYEPEVGWIVFTVNPEMN